MPQLMEIPKSLFQDNTIIAVEFNCWSGVATVREGDEEIFGSRNFDADFFKRGGVILCDKEMLKVFQNRQARLANWLDEKANGQKLPVISGRMFKNEMVPEVVEQILDCKRDIDEIRRIFLDKFPEEKAFRINQFNAKHPEAYGRLDAYYEDIKDLGKKFDVNYWPFGLTDTAAYSDILDDERNTFRANCRLLMEQTAANFRKSVVDAALSFKAGMDRASGTESGIVHARSVKAFQDFLERIERNDFLNDKQMHDMLSDMKHKVFNIASWDVKSDEEAMVSIKAHLDEIVSLGSQEGAISVVVENYILSPGQEQDVVLDEGGGVQIAAPSSEEEVVISD